MFFTVHAVTVGAPIYRQLSLGETVELRRKILAGHFLAESDLEMSE